jgi:aryl-alcohol dehydrogenase-like predicted oxidoreductase
MMQRAIPGTGELLSVIGLGTDKCFDVGEDLEARAPLKAVLKTFAEAGGNIVDCSTMYARTEGVVGKLSLELRLGHSLFYATKVWTRGRTEGIEQMQDSMRKIKASRFNEKTEQISRMDLIQIHNLLDWRTHAKTLQAWKGEGRVRYIGITHYEKDAYDTIADILRSEQFDFLQINYSILEREAEEKLLPLAMDTGHAVLISRPFADGVLFPYVDEDPLPPWAAEIGCHTWSQFFLKFVLSHKAVTCVIPATGNPQHMEDNLQAGIGPLPDVLMRKKMVEYFRSL